MCARQFDSGTTTIRARIWAAVLGRAVLPDTTARSVVEVPLSHNSLAPSRKMAAGLHKHRCATGRDNNQNGGQDIAERSEA